MQWNKKIKERNRNRERKKEKKERKREKRKRERERETAVKLGLVTMEGIKVAPQPIKAAQVLYGGH